jgi:hypothetical protein
VGWCKTKKRAKWRARIRHDGKTQHLGYFADEEEAAAAYQAAYQAAEVALARGEPLPVRPPTSKFRGVSWDQTIAKWRATLTTNGEQTNLGAFRCAHATRAQ